MKSIWVRSVAFLRSPLDELQRHVRRLAGANVVKDWCQQLCHIVGGVDDKMYGLDCGIELRRRRQHEIEVLHRPRKRLHQALCSLGQPRLAAQRDQQVIVKGGAKLTQCAADGWLGHIERAAVCVTLFVRNSS